MKCHCGRDVWLYDASTYTCKAGHHTDVPSDEDVLLTQRRYVIHPAYWGLAGGVIADVILRVTT